MMQERPFYLMVTFWGAKYREYFYSLCVSSLLAPKNVPALKGRAGSMILIATTVEDWNELKTRPLVKLLGSYIELFPIFIGEPGNTPPQLHAAKGHRLACRKAYEDRAFAGWLTPDLILSDGLISKAVGLIDQGKKIVVCPALRFELEHPLEFLSALGYPRLNEPLSLSAESLSALAVESLHPELLRYEFSSGDFGDYPIWTFWRVPGRKGLILYTVSWSLLFADFAAIPKYQDECFAYSTNDGPFAYLNFGHLQNTTHLAFLNDSQDGVFFSVTPKRDIILHSTAARLSNKFHGLLRLGAVKRMRDISRLHRGREIDPLRRSFHYIPVIIHSDKIDFAYQQALAQTHALMTAAINFQENCDYGRLHAVLSPTEASQALPPRIVFRTLLTFMAAYQLIEYCMLVAGRVLGGKVPAEHVFRRALHIMSFGLIYFPGHRNTNKLATMSVPTPQTARGSGLPSKSPADRGEPGITPAASRDERRRSRFQ